MRKCTSMRELARRRAAPDTALAAAAGGVVAVYSPGAYLMHVFTDRRLVGARRISVFLEQKSNIQISAPAWT